MPADGPLSIHFDDRPLCDFWHAILKMCKERVE